MAYGLLGIKLTEMIFGVPLSQLPQELFGSDVIVEGQLNKVLPVSGTSAGKQ